MNSSNVIHLENAVYMPRRSRTTTLVNKWKEKESSKISKKRKQSEGFDIVDKLNGVYLKKKKAQLLKKRRKKKKK